MKSKIFSVILIVSLLFACSNEEVEGEDGLNPFYSETYIRFVSPAGTNVMDSLDMLHMRWNRGLVPVPLAEPKYDTMEELLEINKNRTRKRGV